MLCVDAARSGTLIFSGSKDSTVRAWVLGADGVFGCAALARGHAASVTAVAVAQPPAKNPDLCPFVVSASSDLTIKMWLLPGSLALGQASESEPLMLAAHYTRQAHEKDINCVATAPNNKMIASASQDKTIRLWAAEDGKLLGTLKVFGIIR